MKTRVITGLVAVPIVIAVLIIGDLALYLLISLAMLIALYELNRAFGYDKLSLPAIATMFGSLVYYALIYYNQIEVIYAIHAFVIIINLSIFVIFYPKLKLGQVLINVFGFYYVTVMLSFILLIENFDLIGHLMVWLVLLIAFGSDTSAYFAGTYFGKKKLAPLLSPKKTIAGAIGGVIGTIALTLLFGLALWLWNFKIGLPGFLILALAGFLGSGFSQVGDLVGSAIKRETEIKDFGKILPGHGGILDRLDSILFVAPFVYLATLYILQVMKG